MEEAGENLEDDGNWDQDLGGVLIGGFHARRWWHTHEGEIRSMSQNGVVSDTFFVCL